MIDLYIVHIKENGPLRFNTYKDLINLSFGIT